MKSIATALCVASVLSLVTPFAARGDGASPTSEGPPDWKKLYEDQKQRNDTLERRIAILEEKDASEPYVKKDELPENTLKFLKEVDLSGYVSASYNFNFNTPASRLNTGQGYINNADQFMANKFVAILQKAVDYDAFEWNAGFLTEVIYGQDAAFTQANGLSLGPNGDLEQAYVMVNAPVGNGVKIIFGKYVTPMGYELVENELNPNWTAGYQWTLFEPFTHTGLQLGYMITDQWEANLLINNGWDMVTDNNHSISYMGRLAYTPNDSTSYTLIGYGGCEQPDVETDPVNGVPGANGNWREGVELVMTHQCMPKLGTALQIDYGHETAASVGDPGADAQWWGIGSWFTYDFTEKVQAAFRADYVNDLDGARSSGAPFTAPFPTNNGQELYSLTWTLNYKPVEGLRLAPEIRYDRSTLGTAFDGHDDQVMFTMGAVYSY